MKNKNINDAIEKVANQMKEKIYHYFNVWGVIDYDEVKSGSGVIEIPGHGFYNINVSVKASIHKINTKEIMVDK